MKAGKTFLILTMMAIASDGVAFLTGALGVDSVLPPGKVANVSGFQYLRDNNSTGLGHNADFLFALAATNRMLLEDTGQTNSYTALFGEDADYALNPPAFTNNGGMVYDRVTGRMWQQIDGGEMTWESATNYAKTLALGGYADWRLPTAHELFNIVNHGAANPALDTSVFTTTAAEYWWTQDKQIDNTNNVWVVNAGGGVGAHPKSETESAGGSKHFHVRCVRGAPAPLEAGLRHTFINNSDGTITDLDTGLTWQQLESASVSWTSALHFAESLSLAGYTDWRLPNIKELQSLNDETLATPSLDVDFFPDAQAVEYWSSTTLLSDTNRAWSLDFKYGIASYADKVEPLLVRSVRGGATNAVVASGASLIRLASGLGFTEGPAADASGAVYFSAVTSNNIYRWSLDGQLSMFRTNTGGANGLYFDHSGNLVACEGGNGRITSADPATNITVLADSYNSLRFNEPNDLWIDPNGGIYFTDPVYFGHALVQGDEYVYYLPPTETNAARVAVDLVRPNGIVGTADGQTLYVADWSASNVYRYGIQPDGALTGKTSFASVRCDGMTIDTEGRLYLCETAVRIFDADGHEVERIGIPERPTNVEFGGAQRQFLFITTDSGSLYAVRMSSRGATDGTSSNTPPVISQVIHTPGVPGTTDTVCVTARVSDNSAVASVTLTYAVTLAMLDDGAHQDGSSGDGLYGAYIPPHAAGTTIQYYLTAIDDSVAASATTARTYTVSASVPDSVGDGIPDWWRARYFEGDGTTTNSESCADCDPDDDGDSNREEFIADTNPTNDWDYFIIWDCVVGTNVALHFPSSVNRVYTLHYTTNLSVGSWDQIASQTDIPGNGGDDALHDPVPDASVRFYRIDVHIP